MNLNLFRSTFHGMKIETYFSRIITCALLALVFFLTVVLASRPAIVTIQPWTLSEDAQVTRDDASRSYIEAWGFALAELVGNATPGNVRFISDRLKPLLDPKIYHATLEGLEANARSLVEERITMRFEPRRVPFEKSTGKVYVFGHSFLRQGTSFEQEKREPRTYEFTIRIANYAPLITRIDTYEGSPRTKDIVERDEKNARIREAQKREQIRESSRYIEPKADTRLNSEADRKIQ